MAFSGKRVLVTGSSRGIGQAAARQFFQSGAQVAVNGRTPDSTAAGMAALGDSDRLVAAPGDVSSVAGCEAVVAAAVEGLGGLDILVNSAGVAFFLPLEDSDEAVWDATLDTNLKGTFFCMRAAAGPLRDSGGNIVNVASDAGLIGEKGLSVYCASKGGVVNLTRAMALELAPTVRVNCVCPGLVETDMVHESGDGEVADWLRPMYDSVQLLRPEDIANAVVALVRDDTQVGEAVTVDNPG